MPFVKSQIQQIASVQTLMQFNHARTAHCINEPSFTLPFPHLTKCTYFPFP